MLTSIQTVVGTEKEAAGISKVPGLKKTGNSPYLFCWAKLVGIKMLPE